MQSFFINHTNHPSDTWLPQERAAAECIGPISDVPFPDVDAAWDEEKIVELALEMGKKIVSMNPAAVLCQGEFTYCFALISYLKAHGVRVVSACSKRVVKEWEEEGVTRKQSEFVFVRFRQYK